MIQLGSKVIPDHGTGSLISFFSLKCQTFFLDMLALTADVSNLLWIFKSEVIFASLNQIKKRRLSQWEFV